MIGMPPELIDNHYLSHDNMMDWINVEKFALYLQYLSRQLDKNMYRWVLCGGPLKFKFVLIWDHDSTLAQKMKPSGIELEAAKADLVRLVRFLSCWMQIVDRPRCQQWNNLTSLLFQMTAMLRFRWLMQRGQPKREQRNDLATLGRANDKSPNPNWKLSKSYLDEHINTAK